MPYVITPGIQTTDAGTSFESVAVATLDEARRAANDKVREHTTWLTDAWRNALRAANSLPESGGTIGPLPDGYVVDVQPVCWNWIIGQADDAGVDTDAAYVDGGDIAILRAYNEVIS